jgi:hypothetical protein
MKTATEIMGGTPPTLTATELSALFHDGNNNLQAMVNRGQRNRNVFQRMGGSLYRIILSDFWNKWAN